MILRAEAFAKINRELRVGGRRADGYHEVLSRVVSIDLADRLEVEKSPDLVFTVAGGRVAVDDSNLVVKAARLLASRLSIAPRARIHLEKKIPVGAGLGGGSSDAAVTLRILAQLWGAALSSRELDELAAQLGSDVPFFLTGGEADVAGRGERVTPREDGPPQDLLLFVPPFSLSTAQVYAAYDRIESVDRKLPQRLEVESSGRFFGPNDLASAVLRIQSEMTIYLPAAAQAGGEHAMTGSGSAIVLKDISVQSRRELAERHPECRMLWCRTIGKEEYQRRTHPFGGSPWK